MDKFRKVKHCFFIEKLVDRQIVSTLEGPVKAEANDFIVHGLKGERWPVNMNSLATRYRPTQGATMGETGYYETLPIEVFGYRTQNAVDVPLTGDRGILHASAGDWVLSRVGGEKWVVRPDIFELTYQPIKQQANSKKLLSIDGGGIRGIMSLMVLKEIENCLRVKTGNPSLVLSDYFDYMAGTSAGSVIASCLALGMQVDDVTSFFEGKIHLLFAANPNYLGRIFSNKYARQPMVEALKEVFGKQTTLGSEQLRCMVMLVLLNASTGSPWPVSSNPMAKYNLRTENDYSSNLDILLWQLVRASTAAPYYFPPEVIDIDGKEREFYDGGLTSLNNPAIKLFQMATHPDYRLGWETGEDKLLLVSVGTGHFPKKLGDLVKKKRNPLHDIKLTLESLIFNSGVENDLACRAISKVIYGGKIDSEIDKMSSQTTESSTPRAFSYIRYNPELNHEIEKNLLQTLQLDNYHQVIKIVENPIRLDDISALPLLKIFAHEYAKTVVSSTHFQNFDQEI